MLLSGIFPPITTPFYPDGAVYYKKLESNVERYSRTPVAGIVVQGSTGEAILLSDTERCDVFKAAIAAAAPHKVMIAGTGLESAVETVRLTEYAATLGYDAALVRTPHFYRKQMLAANLLAFYSMVADRSPLPIILYSVPTFTAYDLPAEIVIELSNHPNIIAIKESGGNLDKVQTMVDGTRHIKRQATVTETFAAVTPRMIKAAAAEAKEKQEKESRELVTVEALSASRSADTGAPDTPGFGVAGSLAPVRPSSATKPSSSAVSTIGNLKTRQKEVGFQVLVGAAHQLEPSLALGAAGAILAFACPAPTACYEIYAALKEDDTPLAREKQERLKPAAQRVVSELGVPGIKYAMDLNGYYGGPARLPLLPLNGDQKQEIEQVMSNLRN